MFVNFEVVLCEIYCQLCNILVVQFVYMIKQSNTNIMQRLKGMVFVVKLVLYGDRMYQNTVE
jgi:hypothetical protein